VSKTIVVCKAADEKAQPLQIVVDRPLPPWRPTETREEREAFFEAQARAIQVALKGALPTATYVRVCALMLADLAGVCVKAYGKDGYCV